MLNEVVLITFYVAILLYSVILHEVFHGIAALYLGDPTAKYAGRITANPLKHIDPMMTIFVPIFMLILSGGRFAFGGAKPVPYNPYNLRNQKWGPTLVALAGPGSNIVIAAVAAILARIIALPVAVKMDIIDNFINWGSISQVISGSGAAIFFELLVMVIFWNVLLAFFNLIPIPPLDGSKLLFAIVNVRVETMAIMEQFGFIFLLALIILFSGPLGAFLSLMINLFLSIAV